VTGIDVVREQLRLAAGGLLDYEDPPLHGHAIEFRLNGEDAGNGFLPSPGTLRRWRPPSGPGVRWDGGYEEGDELPAEFDSLLGKLVVFGRDREAALATARRALAEFEVAGIATVLPFDRLLVEHPDFVEAPFRVHTRWIEDDFDNVLVPYQDSPEPAGGQVEERTSLTVEVDGHRLEVSLPASFGGGPSTRVLVPPPLRRAAAQILGSEDGSAGNAVTCPMQAIVAKLVARNGDLLAQGDTVVEVEAMKMEQPLRAPKAGVVEGLAVQVGDQVQRGQVLCRIVEAPGAGEP